jgi:phage terminase large subunit
MSSTAATTEQQTTTYRPYGAALKMLLCQDREVLLHGPAGTGKSMACLMKLYMCAEDWPGMRGFIARKYRASLTDSALVTWEERVLPPGHPALRGPAPTQRHVYRFPNKSTITVIGLDEAEKQKSAEYDMGFIQEITELDEDDLTPVIRGMRYGVMPFQQLLMDCNPGAPDHWLTRRFGIPPNTNAADLVDSHAEGRAAFVSRHEDNPEFWDADRKEWTPFGVTYLAELDKIPNRADRLRLRHGVWAGAEGRVYDGWDALAHVIDPFPIPDAWPRYMGLDFGGSNTAAVFYAHNPDTDQLVLYRTYLHGGRTAGQHIPYLISGEAATPFCVGGAKAEGQWRQEFGEAGLRVHEPKIKDVALGIARVNGQHKKSGILVFKTCTEYIEQKNNYRYLPDAADPEAIERKRHFHYLDAERYIVGYLRPEVDIRRGGAPIYATLKRL